MVLHMIFLDICVIREIYLNSAPLNGPLIARNRAIFTRGYRT